MATAEQLRQELVDEFEASKINYQVFNDAENILSLGFAGAVFDGVVDIRVFVDFDENDNDCDSVHFVVPKLLKVPDEKLAAALVTTNEANKSFRWMKCYLEDDGYICVDADEHIHPGTTAEDCMRTIISMGRICQEIYKMMMRAIYGG